MNYIFHVLWFEDNTGWYNFCRTQIEEIIEVHCLKCEINRKRSAEFEIAELHNEIYDLILMDYDLATSLTGEKIIGIIRSENIYTDILFYSSEYDAMIESVKCIIPPIDGIYYANRKLEEFDEKLCRLVDKIVQRSENLINLRGFVLDNTSDFELRIREVLNLCWQKFENSQKEILTADIIELMDRKANNTSKAVDKFKKKECIFTSVNNNDHLLTIADRLDIMQKIVTILFDEYHMPQECCPCHFRDFYAENISQYRNRLSHIKFGEKTMQVQGKNVEINQVLHRTLRKNITSLEEILSKIEGFISSNI